MSQPFLQNGSPAVPSSPESERLESWKEIAAFFRREVRTVQLWEKHEGLPVHRQQHRKLGSIYALRGELDHWLHSRSVRSEARPLPRMDTTKLPTSAEDSLGAQPHRNQSGPTETDRDRRTLARYACKMGYHYWNTRSRRAIQKGHSYFLDAIDLDPKCAQAYAGLANVYISLSYNHMMPARQAAAKARKAAQRALELDSSSVVVRNAMVNVLTNCAWDWTAAERECRSLLDSGAINSRTIQLYASLLNTQGRYPEAIQLALRALRLEPASAVSNNQVSLSYFYGGDYDNALTYSKRALELTPKYTMGHALLGRIRAQRGEWGEALDAFAHVEENSDRAPFARALVAYAHAGAGDFTAAESILTELQQNQAEPWYPAYDVSGVYSILQRKEEALHNISRACESRDVKAIFVQHDPRFANLRGSSEFQKIASSHLGPN